MAVLTFGALSFDDPWDSPWFAGEAEAAPGVVPRLFPVAIAGHPFPIVFEKYRRTTMQIRRLQTDDSVEPGENSLNATGLWPRSQDNFFLGAGQKFLDNRFAYESVYVHSGEYPSVRTRYWRSKGLDPWQEGALSLQPEYVVKRTSANTNLKMVATLTHLYVADGTDVLFSANPTAGSPTWTSSGIGAKLGGTITGLATDGHTVWACDGTNGIAYSVDGATTATQLVGSVYAATNLWYAKSYLLATTGRDLVTVNAGVAWQGAYAGGTTYAVGDVVSSGGSAWYSAIGSNTGNDPATHTPADWLPLITSIWTHQSLGFTFTTVAETPSCIIVAGNSGPNAFIGSVQADAAVDGATLTVPITASVLPPGETINDIAYSAGAVLLATSQGIRSGTRPDATGIFDVNPVITDPGPVLCVVPWAHFCYFGWTAYSTADGEIYTSGVSSSGIGRADLAQSSTTGIPAYATDRMGADGTTAAVTDVVMFGGIPYFCISGVGLHGPSGNKVASGFIQPGWVRYGTLESKILCTSYPLHDPLLAGQTVVVQVADSSANIVTLGTSDTAGAVGPSSPFGGNLSVGQKFMPVITLTRGTDNTKGPTLRSWTDKAMVVPIRQDEIICPIILRTRVETQNANPRPWSLNTLAEFRFLKGLEASGAPLEYQEGALTEQVYIDQVQVAPFGMNFAILDDEMWFEAEVTVKLITLVTTQE